MRSLISQPFTSTCLSGLSGFLRRFWPNKKPPFDHRIALDMSSAVGYPMVVRLSPWQSATPFAWLSEAEGEPLASGAFLEPPGISWNTLMDTHGGALTQCMPEALRVAINSVPFLGVALAQVAGRLSAALELATSSPLLLILLVDKGLQAQWSEQTLSAALSEKQATLCGIIGLPDTRASAKLLRRCQLCPMIQREFIVLKRALHDPSTTRLLRHYPAPYVKQLMFLANYDGERWPGLLLLMDDALTSSRAGRGSAWLKEMLSDTQRLAEANLEALHRVTTVTGLQALHDRQVTSFNTRMGMGDMARDAALLEKRHGPYPSPPLPNRGAITAITSWKGLLLEGRRMHHCVGSYDRPVALGHVAIYHLHLPESVTIAIAPQGHQWGLSQAHGVRNTQPSSEAQQVIHQWLAEQADA
ncbi:PcfJ domain-containing protein [Halomonas sp. QHL1]|uniref:PcfJ domain-containing protein n=1 Tax=Halomonas sp. QHL1 TaxID=1123773 RepID=UPI0008FD1293|nr:PcfJ domain-containing protein [Halomonas sp. QHL1]OJA06607.1 hypothetical protein QHL1GM_15070 [Halomonas sp. QHL1]